MWGNANTVADAVRKRRREREGWCVILGDAVEFVWIDFPAVPLANVQVSVGVDCDVVTVLEDGLVLEQDRELTVFVARFVSAGVGYHAVGIIKDGDEPAFLPHAKVVRFRSKTHAGIEVTTVNHGTAHVGTGEVNAANVFTFQREPVELVANAFGADEQRFGSAQIYGDAVGLHEASGVCGLGAPAPESADQLSQFVVAQDVLGAVSVGHVDVSVGGDGRFRWGIGVLWSIDSCADGGCQFEEDTTVEVGFHNFA